MQDNFVVEVDRRIVGLAVRAPGGFRFYASDPEFSPLETKTFKRARAVISRAVEFARSRGWRPKAN